MPRLVPRLGTSLPNSFGLHAVYIDKTCPKLYNIAAVTVMNLFRKSLTLVAFLFSLSPWMGISSAPVPSISIGLNFNGSTYSVATPADPDGVVGPRHFVEFINGAFAVYNKTNGVSVRRVSDAHFWS